MMKKVLLATDGSKTSRRALKVAIEMAVNMKAKLTLLGVIDNRLYVSRTVPASVTPTRIAEPVEDYLMQVTGAYLAEAAGQCKRSGIEPEIIIRTGNPGAEILKEARRSRADLLVMGSHGKSGIESVLGSVTYGVLHGESRVPVLVVRK